MKHYFLVGFDENSSSDDAKNLFFIDNPTLNKIVGAVGTGVISDGDAFYSVENKLPDKLKRNLALGKLLSSALDGVNEYLKNNRVTIDEINKRL